jgi:hypothetical protein
VSFNFDLMATSQFLLVHDGITAHIEAEAMTYEKAALQAFRAATAAAAADFASGAMCCCCAQSFNSFNQRADCLYAD